MKAITFCCFLLISGVLSAVLAGELEALFGERVGDDPYIYDRQNTTYHPKFLDSVKLTGANLKITTFFSPDHSIDVLTKAIEDAEESIDIGTPYFRSFGNCSDYWRQPCGCPVDVMRNNESFSVFPALLNAVHRGVKVRIMTNWVRGWVPSEGLSCPLEFLTNVEGVDVRYFTTLTFLHTKYLQIDKKKALVSSVNWSANSVLGNREAGVVIEGWDTQPILDFLTSVFESDFAQAPRYPSQTYTPEQMAIINDKSLIEYTVPTPKPFPGAYVTGTHTVEDSMDFEVFAGPDNSYAIQQKYLDNAKKSFHLFIYQVTQMDLCNYLRNMGINNELKLLVSYAVFSKNDSAKAAQCYQELVDAGIEFRMTRGPPDGYTYSHEKFWIIDDEICLLSTGNWSPENFPNRPDTQPYPPYPDPTWAQYLRDFNVVIHNKEICSVFTKVLDADYDLGTQWVPHQS